MKDKTTALKKKLQAKRNELSEKEKTILNCKAGIKQLKKTIAELEAELSQQEFLDVFEIMKKEGIQAQDLKSAIQAGKIGKNAVAHSDLETPEESEVAKNEANLS